jgi:predicted nucleic acid-binding protein
MKQRFFFLILAVVASAHGILWADTTVYIQRAESTINSGFKERIYIDGRQSLVLTNGKNGAVTVSNGTHTVYAELYTLTTPTIQFEANSSNVQLLITPNSTHDFAIEVLDGVLSTAPVAVAAPARAAPAATPKAPAPAKTQAKPAPAVNVAGSNDSGVEGSLARAAGKIMSGLTPKTRVAIVYVTAKDAEVSEYMAEELEFIMVDKGFILVDRSQLDKIRAEQKFQLSGDVDDSKAISVGKMAGANVIITGSVTGTGDLRRLRLRALDTQTAQVLTSASEKF